MSTNLIFALGCGIFAITTLASLWAGYLFMQRQWVAQNPELTDGDDLIRPLFSSTYPEQGRHQDSDPVAPPFVGTYPEQRDDHLAPDVVATAARPPLV